jgi:hypothetical protein
MESLHVVGPAGGSEVIMGRSANVKKDQRVQKLRAVTLLRSNKGIALAMVLILAAIALAVMAGLLYMLTAGTQISGMQKRYRTAAEAGIGGIDITYQVIQARGNPVIPGIGFLINPAIGTCLDTKLNTPTSLWGGCNSSLAIDPAGNNQSYDMTFTLPGSGTDYTVYSKIVDTVEGNSGGDIGLTKGGLVNTNSGEISVVSIPYLYTIELDVENAENRAERAKFSVLYQY